MLKMNHITKAYGQQEVLSDVSLEMEDGDFLVLFGPDDAGKTSLLHIIMGFDKKYAGECLLFDHDVRHWKNAKLNLIRLVPDDIIWENMTANTFFQMAADAVPDYNDALQEELCQQFEIPLEDILTSMTYAQNKMVQIIAAVCATPRLLILDEPMNFLSAEYYHMLLENCRKWNSYGMSILLVTEKYEHAQGCARKYVFLKEGECVGSNVVQAPDYRKKVVTLVNANTQYVRDFFAAQKDFQLLSAWRNRHSYIYTGKLRPLQFLMNQLVCDDLVIEDLSLEEELEEDYTRWE